MEWLLARVLQSPEMVFHLEYPATSCTSAPNGVTPLSFAWDDESVFFAPNGGDRVGPQATVDRAGWYVWELPGTRITDAFDRLTIEIDVAADDNVAAEVRVTLLARGGGEPPMKPQTKLSRRMFLRGAGGFALAIPTLSSLLTRDARSQQMEVPVRYVQWVTDHGQNADRFWPATAPTTEVAPGVLARPLTDIPGQLSQVLDTAFDPIRAKINLIRGLDLMVAKNFHNACVPTCASWPRVDNHIPEFAHSIDSVLETSPVVYPNPSRMPALRLTPGVNSGYKWGSFSWTTRDDGSRFKLPAYDSTETAFEAVFGSGATGSPLVDPVISRRRRLADQVLEDYRTTLGSGALSTPDRQLLSDYMDLLQDLQTRMSVEAPTCTPPEQLGESDFEILHRNAVDIAVAALLCSTTRVVAYHTYQGSPSDYDEETFHAWAHDDASKHAVMQNWRYRQFAALVRRMDEATDTNGKSLLENSVVYSGNELSVPGHGSGHLRDMPTILAGAAGGRLVTGQYIDYGGRLLNNLLVTLFNVMGLEPADYERNGVVGFGDYEGNSPENYSQWVSNTERRSPLPYLYQA